MPDEGGRPASPGCIGKRGLPEEPRDTSIRALTIVAHSPSLDYLEHMRRDEAMARLKAAEPVLQQRLGRKVDYTTRDRLHRRLRPAIEMSAIRVF